MQQNDTKFANWPHKCIPVNQHHRISVNQRHRTSVNQHPTNVKKVMNFKLRSNRRRRKTERMLTGL